MNKMISFMIIGFLLTSSTTFCVSFRTSICTVYDRTNFLQACNSITIDDFVKDPAEDCNPMDDDMVQAIESRYRQESFRDQKIAIPKIQFAREVGREIITTIMNAAETYKESALQPTHTDSSSVKNSAVKKISADTQDRPGRDKK